MAWLLAAWMPIGAIADSDAPGMCGLVAHWDFGEGAGTRLHDRSGHENHGTLRGAAWVKEPTGGYSLSFDGSGAYVDCGAGPSLDLTEAMTLEAWVYPNGKPSGETGFLGKFFDRFLLTYYVDGNCWWYIAAGSNHCKALLESDGWHHIVATFDGEFQALYIDGAEAGRSRSKAARAGTGGRFLIGRTFPRDEKVDPEYGKVRSFRGRIRNVLVYHRALIPREIRHHYREAAGDHGHDTSGFDRVVLTAYPYPRAGRVVAAADLRGLAPLADDGVLDISLGAATQRFHRADIPAGDRVEAAFTLAGLEPGSIPLAATYVEDGAVRARTITTVQHPHPEPAMVSPQERTVPPLAPPPPPAPCRVDIAPGGGLSLEAGGVNIAVTSRFSRPGGGFHLLGAETSTLEDPNWRVTRHPTRVEAVTDAYALDRRIESRPTHVHITDTIVNNGTNDVGIKIHHELGATDFSSTERRVAGWTGDGRKEEMACPSVFAGRPGWGVALVPVDDLFVIQCVVYADHEKLGLATEQFALPPGGSYTFEWRIYTNPSGDYFDFVNAFRHDEKRIGTVDGGLGMFTRGPFDRRQIPSPEYIELRNVKYGAIHCLSGAADDPLVSIEGIEFMDFPREMELLKQQVGEIKRLYPDFKVMFHVAHSLYATDQPDRFPDAKVIQADGTHTVWADDGRYIKPERQEAGWRWWIYYPVPGNSFHEAMMRSIDVMMDEIGCDGAFMDGFFWGYRGRWSYDRWDGLSADLDPVTHTIRRKKASVLYLSQPSMIEFARRIRDKGGVVVANNAVITRSIADERYLIHDKEVSSGPFLHLAPVATALSDPSRIKTEQDIYLDALDKLRWGMLYFYYEEGEVTYPSLPAQMFPMTFDEIRGGTVRGPDRIVTLHPGVYGWPGDQRLHHVFRYDERGGLAPHAFITTVDSAGARTELQLEQNESAVIVPLPVELQTESPVNVRVIDDDGQRVRVQLSGKGKVTLGGNVVDLDRELTKWVDLHP